MKKLILWMTIAAAPAFSQGPPGGGDMSGGRNRESVLTTLQNSQPKGNSKITGTVTDSLSAEPVAYATVSLINRETGKVTDGAMAGDNGEFILSQVAAGEYTVQISFVGYQDKKITGVKVQKGKDVALGTILLPVNTRILEEVKITGVRALIEEKVDRLVYNAEGDITAKGGDASDILKKVPMLTVDLDGNVSLRGSSNIRVLINNKPSTIVASSIADALKMIPADLIKTVEVITSPSAKYDAEGSGGIINIITKKSDIQGLTLNIDSGVGLRASNLGLNGNYRNGKFGMTLGGFGRLFYNRSGGTLDQTTFGTASVRTQQTSSGNDNGMFGRYNLGFDYDISQNQSLSAGIAFGTRNLRRDLDYTTKLFTDNTLESTSFREVDGKDNSNNVDVNLDYIRIFKPQQELYVSTYYSRNNLVNNFDADILNNAGEILSRMQNRNDNTNQEFTVQTDFVTPVSTNQLFEVGLKGIFRGVNSDYKYLSATGSGNFITDPTNPSGFLDYTQNIGSGYLSYTYTTADKFTFKVGGRYEYTSIDALDQRNEISIPSYGNLVPSVNISKSFANGSTVKLAYNKRIQRPGLQQLNPNYNASNPQNISIGNPDLKPEITDNVELSLSTFAGKNYFNFSLFGRQTNNGVMRITTPSDTVAGAMITTFENIGTQRAFGGNLFGNLYLTPKWTLNGGLDLYYAYMEGQIVNADGTYRMADNAGFVLGGRMQSQVVLPDNWTVQAFGGFRGKQVQLQGTMGSFYMYSVGVKKEFNNKKGSIGLAAENFLGGMKMNSTVISPLYEQYNRNNIYNQNIKLTFSYSIGKMAFVQKKTRSVKNDDVIGGGSEAGQQQK
ncbi:MAG: TonB-dependent receptor family protein [Leadbetterella sp.]|nr:TonB-dependent receptor family protein [Leadbetterella sp.]